MAQPRTTATVPAAFDKLSIAALRRRTSDKWRHYPADVLPAFVAEMDFALAPPVQEALAEAVRRSDTGYTSKSDELSGALASFAAQRFDWQLDPADVHLIPDVMVGITELLRVVAAPGDAVVINPPVYPPFFTHIAEAGCRVVEAPLADGKEGYALDLLALERVFQNKARVYLLCNPHNPTGRVFERAELERIAELAEAHDVLVLADEIHAPLALPGARHIPFLSLGRPATDRTIAFVSATKGWNIPGLKCAQVVVASDAMRSLIERLPEELIAQVGNLGVTASIAAYRDGVSWLDDLLLVIDRNRRLMAELLREQLPAVRYQPPQGTYLAWLDCRPLNLPVEPVDFFLEHGRVALGPGPKFGSAGTGFVRVTMGTSAGILSEVVGRMRAAVEGAR